MKRRILDIPSLNRTIDLVRWTEAVWSFIVPYDTRVEITQARNKVLCPIIFAIAAKPVDPQFLDGAHLTLMDADGDTMFGGDIAALTLECTRPGGPKKLETPISVVPDDLPLWLTLTGTRRAVIAYVYAYVKILPQSPPKPEGVPP